MQSWRTWDPHSNPTRTFVYDLLGKWPLLEGCFPDDGILAVLYPFAGICREPHGMDKWFLHSMGGLRFLRCDVPERFCWIGIRGGLAVEYLLAMWRSGERKFWFFSKSCGMMDAPDPAPARTKARLAEALRCWNRGKTLVLFTSAGGWLGQGGRPELEDHFCEWFDTHPYPDPSLPPILPPRE